MSGRAHHVSSATSRSPRRSGIVLQTVLLASAIAAIAVLVAGAAAAPFVRAAAETEARGSLATLADVTATFVERRDSGRAGGRALPQALGQVLRQEQVTGFVVTPELPRPEGISEQDVEALIRGDLVSRVGDLDTSQPYLIEGRPISGGGVILIQPLTVAGEATSVFLLRIILALGMGLLIAVVIAYFAARRLSRPLRAARDVAHRMAEGERDQMLAPRGPTEVADIADALNALNAALVVSEGRQREFLLSVSHELRTPLTAVKGYGEALADGVLPADEITGVGATVASEAERLDRLVNDLLDLARLGAVDFHFDLTEVDLREVLAEAGQVWRDRCARVDVGFEVQEQAGASSVRVRADGWRVRQIIDNLAENALRVSPAGSTIVFALHTDPTVSGGPYAVLEVRDGGPGLSPQDLAIAFEPGALHERYRGVRPVGTGLGLALVARLASGMDGSATVTSTRGEGTSFWVRLPLVEP